MRDPAAISSTKHQNFGWIILAKARKSTGLAFNGGFDEEVFVDTLQERARSLSRQHEMVAVPKTPVTILWSSILSSIGNLPQNAAGKFSFKLQDIADAYGLDTSHAHVSA